MTKTKTDPAKILLVDIETCANLVLSWNIGQKVSLSYDNIVTERRIICICYKWLGESEVHSFDWGVKKQCDKKMLQQFLKIVEQADLVVGHNGDRFDLKFINGRLLYHSLPPLPKVATEDTLKMGRRTFYLNCQRLDYLGEYTNLGRKLDTGGYGLWKKVHLEKDVTALGKMIDYCKQDVQLLEDVYLKILPYVSTQSVEKSNLLGTAGCPACGSTDTQKRGVAFTKSGKYQRHSCKSCGHWYRDTKMIKRGN